MVELSYLSELIKILRANGILKFKSQDLELSLGAEKPEEVPLDKPSTLVEDLAANLKGNDLFNEDKALFWSSEGAGEVPLTGQDGI